MHYIWSLMCGICGIFGQPGIPAAHWASEALFAQQHRGQDACGLVSLDESGLHRERGLGLVRDVLTPRMISALPGHRAVAHVRYPTQGAATLPNAQPHLFENGGVKRFALASNGDITNLPELRRFITDRGYTLEGSNDAEVIAKCIGIWAYDDGLGLDAAIARWMETGRGAYSTVLLDADHLYAFRDPDGLRPMSLGEKDGVPIVVSETVALDVLRARFVEHVMPGSILRWGEDGFVRREGAPRKHHHHCIFELIYFSRPDSRVFSEEVFSARHRIGTALAEGDTVEADVVIPIPDSANYIALAYAKARAIPFAFGLVRNHYVGRTFIAPEQRMRDESVRRKFNPLPGFIQGKRVVLVDDSIVRGTTLRKLVRMIRENGASEVHVRIGSPPIRHSCYYGIDTPERDKLVAAGRNEDQVAQYIGADTLRYLTLPGLRSTVAKPDHFCYACFTGDYPAGMKDQES
ncbi:MAG: amidophosphoribosyltransferase [Acidobacteriota bacterium]